MKTQLSRSIADRIVEECCRTFNVSVIEVMSHRRIGEVVVARHCAMWLMVICRIWTQKEVGTFFHCGHTNVSAAISSFKNRMIPHNGVDPQIVHRLEQWAREIKTGDHPITTHK